MRYAEPEERVRERWSTANVLRGSDVTRHHERRLALLVAMVVGLTALLAWPLRRSGFVGSDYFSFRDAKGGLSVGFLLRPVFDHFVPGHRFGMWLVDAVAPFRFGFAMAVSLAVFVVTLLVFHRLLAELFRPGAGPLLLTFLYGASAIQLGTAEWWSAALSRMPSALFVFLSMLLYLRFRRRGQRALLAGSVVALGLALLVSEDAALALGGVIALRLLILDPGESLRDAVRGALSEWRDWVWYLIPIAVSFIGVTAQTHAASGIAPPLESARYLGAAWFHAFVPSLFGLFVNTGPLSGFERASVVIAQLLLAGLVAWTVMRSPAQAGRAWAFFGTAFLATQLPVAAVRTGVFPAELVAHQYRYYSLTIGLFVIAVGASLLPVREDEGAPPLSAASDGTKALLVALAVVYVAVSGIAAGRMVDEFYGSRSGPYLRALQTDIDRLPAGARVLDGEVPKEVIERLFAPDNRLSFLFPVMGHRNLVGTESDRGVYRVMANGHLQKVTFIPLVGGSAVAPYASDFTVAPVEARSAGEEDGEVCVQSGRPAAAVGLTPPVSIEAGDWYLRVRYRTAATGIGFVFLQRLGAFDPGPDPKIPLVADRHEAVVPLGQDGFAGVVIALPAQARVCISEISIALVVPAIT